MEGSGEAVYMHKLARAFTSCICNVSKSHQMHHLVYISPALENLILLHAYNKDADQLAHPYSLFSTFRKCYGSYPVYANFNFLDSLCG